MVLQDLGRRINAAVNDLTRSSNLDEKVSRSIFPFVLWRVESMLMLLGL
jgi:hypothetical protein